MKFGDLVVNEWAGRGNPTKVMMVIHHGKNVKCLAKNGREVIFANDKGLGLTKVGRVNFDEWAKLLSEHTDLNGDK